MSKWFFCESVLGCQYEGVCICECVCECNGVSVNLCVCEYENVYVVGVCQ